VMRQHFYLDAAEQAMLRDGGDLTLTLPNGQTLSLSFDLARRPRAVSSNGHGPPAAAPPAVEDLTPDEIEVADAMRALPHPVNRAMGWRPEHRANILELIKRVGKGRQSAVLRAAGISQGLVMNWRHNGVNGAARPAPSAGAVAQAAADVAAAAAQIK